MPTLTKRQSSDVARWLARALMTLLAMLALPSIALGITFTVNRVGDDDDINIGDSFCDADAATSGGQCTLRAAIQEANAHAGDDRINFFITNFIGGGGNDIPTITLTSALPDLSTNIEIMGPGANKLAVSRTVSAYQYSIFTATEPGVVTVSGLTIRDGGSPAQSERNDADITMSTGNEPNRVILRSGGGVTNRGDGTLNVRNCIVVDNRSRYGGGVANNPGILNLTNCIVSDNIALGGSGGGIYNGIGTVNVTHCTITGNTVTPPTTIDDPGAGGGFSTGNGAINFANSTISDNHVMGETGAGGGFWIYDGTVNVINCTLSGNTAEAEGGGIYNYNATVNLLYSTVTGNSAGDGGGVFTVNVLGGKSKYIRNSLIALNTATNSAPDLSGEFTTQGFNLIGKNAGAASSFPAGNPNTNKDIVGTSVSAINPMLDPNGLQDNAGLTPTIALLPNSPAIDKGNTPNNDATLPTTDQRGIGFLRTIDNPAVPNAIGGDGTDIGAYELGAGFNAVSRKIHGSTPFDINLPLVGAAGIECRSGGASEYHRVVVNFPAPVSLTSASVTTGTGQVADLFVTGSEVTADLTGVVNAQKIIVTLFDVSDGRSTNDVDLPMALLLGDTTGSGTVNASDVSQTKSKSGQAVNASTFRTDVTVSNSINSSDVSLVKSKSGTGLP